MVISIVYIVLCDVLKQEFGGEVRVVERARQHLVGEVYAVSTHLGRAGFRAWNMVQAT